MSYLAAHDGACKKAVALIDLFGEGVDDSTRAYLRQAIKRLRDALPDPGMLAADDADISWTAGQIVTESLLLEESARLARRLQGAERLDATERALAVWDGGEYLPGSNAPWVHARRTELEELALDLHLDASTVAFELGDLERARRHADLVVRLDGYRESAWRLAMRIAAAMGHDDHVIGLYRQCRERLAEVPTQPAASTQRLLAELRR
jgi:DNA-binding SARP family transcriptional activator